MYKGISTMGGTYHWIPLKCNLPYTSHNAAQILIENKGVNFSSATGPFCNITIPGALNIILQITQTILPSSKMYFWQLLGSVFTQCNWTFKTRIKSSCHARQILYSFKWSPWKICLIKHLQLWWEMGLFNFYH